MQNTISHAKNNPTSSHKTGDHSAIKRPQSFGVLLLHGYTSSLDAVNGLVPYLEKAGIPYEMPLLRGHGKTYKDLRGVTADDWLHDANEAYLRLKSAHEKVLIVGLSMGGLVTLNLASMHSESCIGAVTWAAALDFQNPLSRWVGLLKGFIPYWQGQESFNNSECRKNNRNYAYFSTDSFYSLYHFAAKTKGLLAHVKVPLCIIHSEKDQVIKPKAAQTIFDSVKSPYRELHWLKHSGHELGQDLEAEHVFELTMQFIDLFRL